jgi:hypothetical protein
MSGSGRAEILFKCRLQYSELFGGFQTGFPGLLDKTDVAARPLHQLASNPRSQSLQPIHSYIGADSGHESEAGIDHQTACRRDEHRANLPDSLLIAGRSGESKAGDQ